MANPFQDEAELLAQEDPIHELNAEEFVEQSAEEVLGEQLEDAAFEEGDKPDVNAQTEENYSAFARGHNLPLDEAESLLDTYSPDDARTIAQAKPLIKENPNLIDWAARNYKFYKQNAQTINRTVASAQTLQRPKQNWLEKHIDEFPEFIEDIPEAIYRNLPMLENAVAVGLYSVGVTSKEQFADALDNIDKRRQNFTPYQSDMRAFRQGLKKWNLDRIDNLNRWYDLKAMPTEDVDDLFKYYMEGASLGGELVSDILDIVWSSFSNPYALTLTGFESAGSMLGPTAASVATRAAGTAVGGIIGGPPGAVIGYGIGTLGGALGSGAVRYAESINEEMQEYRNADGTIDYLAVINDPIKMQRIHDISMTYGIVGGSLDSTIGFMGGKLAKTRLAAGAIDILGEGIAEGGATTAKQIAKGDQLGEAVAKGLEQAVIESILVTPTLGTANAIGFLPGLRGAFRNKFLLTKREFEQEQSLQEKRAQVTELRKDSGKAVGNGRGNPSFQDFMGEYYTAS